MIFVWCVLVHFGMTFSVRPDFLMREMITRLWRQTLDFYSYNLLNHSSSDLVTIWLDHDHLAFMKCCRVGKPSFFLASMVRETCLRVSGWMTFLTTGKHRTAFLSENFKDDLTLLICFRYEPFRIGKATS